MEFDTNPLLALAVIVLSGVLAGQLAHRLRAPRITGPIVIGVVLGATGIHLFSAATIDSLAVVTEFALGLLNVARLRNAGRRLFLLLVTAASFVTLLLVAGTAHALGVSVLLSCLFLGVALANLTPNKEELGASRVPERGGGDFRRFLHPGRDSSRLFIGGAGRCHRPDPDCGAPCAGPEPPGASGATSVWRLRHRRASRWA